MSFHRQSNRFSHTKFPGHSSHISSSDFDHDSGLAYDQVEVRGPYGFEMSWISNYKHGPIAKIRISPNDDIGARTLTQMALIKASQLSQDLTVETLRALPYTLGQFVWQRIIEDHLESYQTWRVFATAYGSDFATPENRYLLDIKTPVLDHAVYYRGLDSRNAAWLTCLRISPKATRLTDLVSISNITNLSVLDLSDGQLYMETRESTFDQRLFRSWSELAIDRCAFKCLRVLMLGWQEKVGGWIFEYLGNFPKLNLFITTDCPFIDHKNHRDWEQQAWTRGWEILPSKRGVKRLRQLLTDPTFYNANVSSMYYESVDILENDEQGHRRNLDHPLLECWIGAPKVWSHVLDDFPGTKTVFFRRKSCAKPVELPRPLGEPFHVTEGLQGRATSNTLTTTKATVEKYRRRIPKQNAVDLLAQLSAR